MTVTDLLGSCPLAAFKSEWVAGLVSEWVAAFMSEWVAGLIGIRNQTIPQYPDPAGQAQNVRQ